MYRPFGKLALWGHSERTHSTYARGLGPWLVHDRARMRGLGSGTPARSAWAMRQPRSGFVMNAPARERAGVADKREPTCAARAREGNRTGSRSLCAR